MVSISLLVISLFVFSIFFCLSFRSCTFLRISPFLPNNPFYWYIVACSSLLCSLYFCDMCSKFSFFICNFIDLSPLLSVDELARGVSVLFIFSSSLLLVSLIFSFFHFYFIYFSDLHDDAFLLITLDFFL